MRKILLTTLACLLSISVNASIITESFTGVFDNDDSRFYITFDVTQDNSIIDFTSLGYAGGVNGDGATIADGGFDTQLFLFGSSGFLVMDDDNDEGHGPGPGTISASSQYSYDAFIRRDLNIGSYTIVLTQYNNDFISGDLLTGVWQGSDETNFDGRTSFYALDISGENLTNVGGVGHNTTTVPEPGSIALLGLAICGLATRRKLFK
ncbi:MAG: hypothetical protein ACI9LM_000224 [Alteromonadaceae bacterium]|jgi:hypothetical protein